MNVFSFTTNGTVSNRFLQLEQRYGQSSDQQLVLVTNEQAIVSGLNDCNYYDVVVDDHVRQPGNIKGGLHAGEPLVDQRLTVNPPFPDTSYANVPNEITGTICGDSLNVGWAGAAGGWAFNAWKGPLCLATNYNFISSFDFASAPGGDNSPQIITEQPVGNGSNSSVRFANNSSGLAAEIAFHKIVLAMPRTN